MCINCMVPATMMRSNSGMSWDFHHRRTKFFMSRVRSLPKHFLCSVTFLGTKTTMLLAPFVACSPYLFYAKNICHLDSLLEPIKNIVNPILLGWKTHITIFFTIVVAGIHLIRTWFCVRTFKSHSIKQFGGRIYSHFWELRVLRHNRGKGAPGLQLLCLSWTVLPAGEKI